MKGKVVMSALAFGLTVLVVVAADAAAQKPRHKPLQRNGNAQKGFAKEGKRPLPPFFGVLDKNGDRVIAAEEIANAPEALKQLDKNGDGKLTPDEYRLPRGQKRGAGAGRQAQQGTSTGAKIGNIAGERPRPLSPIFAALDANGDRVIEAQETANASEALKTLDKNGDGKVTPDEYRPARSAGQGGAKDAASATQPAAR